MNFGGTLVIRNMLKIALAILASLVKFQDCLHCLEARTDFVFLLATNTRQLWLVFTFFPKISSWHKIQVMALLRQAVRSVAQAGCFQTSAWWVFFPCSQPFVIPVHFWQVPALRAAAPGHVLFQSQPFFLGSTSLHLIPIKRAIVVCWQYRDLMLYWLVCLLYPLEFAWLRWLVPV